MPAMLGLWCAGAFIGVACLAVMIGRAPRAHGWIYGICGLVALAGLTNALAVLVAPGAAPVVTLPVGLPWLGARFRLDPLAALFLAVINGGGAVTSLYGLGYGRHEVAPLRVLPFFPAFLAAMSLVVLAADAFSFLLAWELMSLVSWALVVSGHRAGTSIRAGYVYLLMASFGTFCLLLAFGLLAGPDGGYAFETMRSIPHAPAAVAAALILVLIGAGSKAGLVPLHVWLPLAHPAAPSHVSGLLSGVMTKVAVYAFLRIVFDLIHAPSAWMSMLVLAVGGISAVIGVLSAVMQQDLKRLLAYSTVENVGIIFIALGLAMAFAAQDIAWAAALAMTAALFHVVNHALFKSLLFFGAGAVLSGSGERHLDRLGGLIHRMPVTAAAFLVGCAAIAALPPLNGFASEWLTFQAILVSPQLPHLGLKFLIPAVGALMALAAALAAACFVKAFGIVFLGRPRSPAAAAAQEIDRPSRAAMLGLAGFCMLAGILPGMVIDGLAPVVQALTGARLPVQAVQPWLAVVPIAQNRSSYDGLIILVFLAVAGGVTAWLIHRLAGRAVRRSAIWDCGFPADLAANQYTGASFAMPLRRVFGATLFRVVEHLDMPAPGAVRAGRFHVRVFDPAWRLLYGPLARHVTRGATRLNVLQFLTIRRYLTLMFAALIVLLIVVAAWR